ncbi:MAG: hypothetical protein PHG08_00180 [Bacilli bacterium]|nr:hypothetical protein [Bacilli bacterium]
MKYNDIRSKIKSGDVLAWTHKEWGSWYNLQIQAVRMFTRSEFSHVGIAWVVDERVFVIEAVVPKVRVYLLSDEVPCYWMPCGESYWNEIVEKTSLSYVGQKYSKWQAILAAINKLKCGVDAKWECAELVNKILQNGNLLKEGEALSTPTSIIEKLLYKDFPLYIIE